MLATIARPTAVAAAIEEPTVTFNAIQRQSTATVIVFLPPGQEKVFFEDPLIAIPGPSQQSDLWTVIWTLVPGPGITSVFFSTDKAGIEIPQEELPPRLQIMESSPVLGEPSQWQVTFRNNVISANSFNYAINAEAIPDDARQLKPIRHDPTIVVTQDPIG
jgi:hypothetical protein